MDFLTLLTTVVIVLLAIFIHLGAMRMMYVQIPRRTKLGYELVGILILVAIIAHVLEISLFAIGLGKLISSGNYGQLGGAYQPGFPNDVYYSAVTYTALGFGDITPTGALRFFTAIEALTGLVLIAWTSSTIFLLMQQHWVKENRHNA